MPKNNDSAVFQATRLSIVRLCLIFFCVFSTNTRAQSKVCEQSVTNLVEGTNDLEIEVHGLWRSGHHAIMSWFAQHFADGHVYVNDRTQFMNFCQNRCFILGDFPQVLAGRPVRQVALAGSLGVDIYSPDGGHNGYDVDSDKFPNFLSFRDYFEHLARIEMRRAGDLEVPPHRDLYIRNIQNLPPHYAGLVPPSNPRSLQAKASGCDPSGSLQLGSKPS